MSIATLGMVLDLNANTISQSNNSSLSLWEDQSGNSNDVSQSVESNKPIFHDGTISANNDFLGNPWVSGDKTNDFLDGGNSLQFLNNEGLTIFAVVQVKETGNSNRNVIARDTSGNRGYLLGIDGSNGKVIWIISNSSTSRIRRNGSLVDCRGFPCLITARYSGGVEQSIRVNGIDDSGSIDGSIPSSIGGNGPTLKIFNSGWSEPLGGRIARIIVYDRVISDSERDEVENILMKEYNLFGLSEADVSPDINCHQGYSFDGTSHYTFDTNRIDKRDSNWSTIISNSNPFSGLSTSYNHVGDGVYYNGKIYVGCTLPPSIFIFDADTLSRLSVVDVSDSANQNSAASLTIDTDNEIMYLAEWIDSPGINRLLKYDLAGNFLGTLNLTTDFLNIIKCQGITYLNGRLYLNASEGTTEAHSGILFEVNIDSGFARPIWHVTRHSASIIPEGMQAIDGGIRWLFDTGSNELVYTYTSPKFNKNITFYNSNLTHYPALLSHSGLTPLGI